MEKSINKDQLNWDLEMYKFYVRQTLLAVKEYNDKIEKMKEVSGIFTPITDNLKGTMAKYSI